MGCRAYSWSFRSEHQHESYYCISPSWYFAFVVVNHRLQTSHRGLECSSPNFSRASRIDVAYRQHEDMFCRTPGAETASEVERRLPRRNYGSVGPAVVYRPIRAGLNIFGACLGSPSEVTNEHDHPLCLCVCVSVYHLKHSLQKQTAEAS